MPEESLTLNVEVDGFEEAASEIQGVEEELQKTDREITDTGKGRDEVRVDFDGEIGDLVADVAAVKSSLESIEDEVTVDVDAETTKSFDNAVNNAPTGTVSGDGGGIPSTPTDEDTEVFPDSDFESTGIKDDPSERADRVERQVNAIVNDPFFNKFGDDDAVMEDLEERREARRAGTPFVADSLEGAQLDGDIDSDEITAERIDRLTDEVEADSIFDEFAIDDDLDSTLEERRQAKREADPFVDADLAERQLAFRGGPSDIDRDTDLREVELRMPDRRPMRRQDGFLTVLKRESKDLIGEFRDAEFTIEEFHKIFAAAVPILATFIAAIPAAVSAMAALATSAIAAAGGLAALGGLAIGGMMLTPSGQLSTAPLMERLRSLFDTFLTEFAPVMRQFEGLAIGAFNQFEQMLGPLANAASTLTILEDEFNAVLGAITGGLPRAVQTMAAFAEVTAPVLGMVMGQLFRADVLTFFVEQLNRLAPTIFTLIASVKQLLPALVILSEGALMVVTSLLGLGTLVASLINTFPILGRAIGGVLSLLAVYVGIATAAKLATDSFAISLLRSAITGIQNAIFALAGYNISMLTATALTATLAGILTLGLAPALGFVSGGFLDLSDSISLANSELEKFNRLTGQVPDGPVNASNPLSARGSGGNVYNTINIEGGNKGQVDQAAENARYEFDHTNSVFD